MRRNTKCVRGTLNECDRPNSIWMNSFQCSTSGAILKPQLSCAAAVDPRSFFFFFERFFLTVAVPGRKLSVVQVQKPPERRHLAF